jgi:multicomponent Na+:H+ antiporter subunit E
MTMFRLKTALLALTWIALTGSFTIANLLFGLALTFFILWLVRGPSPAAQSFRFRHCVGLLLLFVRELVVSAWRVAVLVVSPKMDLKPGIFAYPLKGRTDFEITMLANLVTLTPGTLSVDVSPDRRTLYVHAIDCADPEQTIRDIKQSFERRIVETFGR